MARKKTGQRKVGGHTAENMLQALILHRQGSAIRKAARDCNVLYSTLNRYIKKYTHISIEDLKNQRLTPHYNVNKIFTSEQEAELTAYIKECGTKVLSTKDVRRAAYELAAVNNIEAPESWEREKMAGKDWMRSFRDRNFGAQKVPIEKELATEKDVEAVSGNVKDMVKAVTDEEDDSSDKGLKTLELDGSVDGEKAMIAEDDIVDMEPDNPDILIDTLKTNTANLVTGDPDITEIIDEVTNELEEQNQRSLLYKEAETKAIFKDSINIKIEEPESFEDSCSQDPLSDKEDAEDSGGVWSYYEHLPSGRGRCVVCRATVARGGLKGHLRSHHPKLVAEVDLGSDEEVSDSQEDVYTEVVYLEEEQNAKKAKSVLKKKTKPTSSIERPEPRKRQASSSSDEIPLKQKKTEDNDEIEQFGKYVTCLLRKIPPAECMELQGEIINLIMKKQLELKRKTLLLTGADKMAASESPSVMSFENTPSTSNSLSCNNGYPNTTYTKE